MASTVEQVRKELENVVRRLKETKDTVAGLKNEWPSVNASGDKKEIADWKKRRDQVDEVRRELKADRQALGILINENEHLHSLKEEFQQALEV